MGLVGEDEPDLNDKKDITRKASKYQKVTRLYKDMEILEKYLLGKTHQEFLGLPLAERLKWYLYDEMKEGRIKYFKKNKPKKHKSKQKKHKGMR